MGIRDIVHLKRLNSPLLWNLLVCNFVLSLVFAHFAYEGLLLDFGVIGYIGFGICGVSSFAFMFHALVIALHIRKRYIEEPA